MAATQRLSVGSLILVTLILLAPLEAQGSDDNDYIRRLEEAYNSTGIPWDQVLVDDTLETFSAGIGFDCNTDIEAKATNVNELTPADIKVVGALGDSITAAMGAEANCIFQALREYRGVSWSIGGDGDLSSYTTLPNIIKKYNPSVRGYSIKYGSPTSKNAHNNVAVSGATAVNMPSQARNLVDKITKDREVDVDNDWKLVTLWIGGNDLCAYCKGKKNQLPENYGAYIREALNILKEMPRTFVNLVKILDVTKLDAVGKDGGLFCKLIHPIVCSCGISKKDAEETKEGQKLYNEELQKIVDDDEFHTDDFTVVLQPFMENIDIPRKDNGKVDTSYFAIDCFHFRTKGHRVAAGALWNNMMEPVGQKTDDWDIDPNMKLKCPPEGAPYFYTKKNSLLFSSFGAVPGGADTQGGAQAGSANLLTILLGTGVAILVVVVITVGGVVSAVLYKRRQHRRRNLTPGTVGCDTERVYLIKKN